MPKIQVNERDLSWYYRYRGQSPVRVLVPGVATFGPTDKPVLVNSKTFTNTFGESAVDPEDLSYHMARSYAYSGADVIFWRLELDGASESHADIKINKTTGTGNSATTTEVIFARVEAKYTGSFGDNLTVKVVGNPFTTTFIYVYYGSTLLEKLVYNFYDRSSDYWYETVNKASSYVEVVQATTPLFPTLPTEDNVSYGGYSTNEVNLTGGSDHGKISSGKSFTDFVAEKLQDSLAESSDYIKILKDPLSYDFNIITNGGYNNYKVEGSEDFTKISKIDEAFISVAESRGTAIYLVDGSSRMNPDVFYTYTGSSKNSNGPSQAGFNTSYAAAFGPWCTAQLVSSGAIRELPGSYVFIISWCNSLSSGSPEWLAPAGVKRASVGSIVRETTQSVGLAVLDQWQNHEDIASTTTSHNINPIMKLKQYGYVIYGNSTLLQTRFDGSSSMLQSLSVRLVSNMIKSRAFDTSLYLQFDQIDDDLFAQFKVLLGSYLDELKYGGALYDYKLVVDRSNMTLDDLNSRTVPVRIMISPNPAAENFVINLEISQAGVTFSDDSTDNEQ